MCSSDLRPAPPANAATILVMVRASGGAGRLELRRRASRRHITTAQMATRATMTIHPTGLLSVPEEICTSTWSRMRMAPPLPSTNSMTPFQNSRPPRVTTKKAVRSG